MEQQTRRQGSFRRKKQPTARRTDTPLHTAARAGNLAEAKKILSFDGDGCSDSVAINSENVGVRRRELIAAQNELGETALFVAAESGHLDILTELLNYADEELAEVKTRGGCDALHAAAKHGHIDVVKALLAVWPGLATTTDSSSCTPLYSAATLGHVELVEELLAADPRLLKLAKSNGKTALHSAGRGGHVEVVRALLAKDRELCGRKDNKGQTALHMAVKGRSVDVVRELVGFDPQIVNLDDKKGNTALHVATRKGRLEVRDNDVYIADEAEVKDEEGRCMPSFMGFETKITNIAAADLFLHNNSNDAFEFPTLSISNMDMVWDSLLWPDENQTLDM